MSLKTKSELRSYYKKLRENLSPAFKTGLDKIITKSFLSLDEYKISDTVLAFVSKGIEFNTGGIISDALSRGKTLAVPRCGVEKGVMSFYEIKSYDDLEEGYFGIFEPKKTCCELIDFSNSICLVPGLAYDSGCFRVGFGGGYYDRFLSEYTGVSVGVCYSRCIEDELPKDEYDCPVDILVTDINIFRKDNVYGL